MQVKVVLLDKGTPIPHNILCLICGCVNACQKNYTILMLLLSKVLLIVVPRAIYHGRHTNEKERIPKNRLYTSHGRGRWLK